MGLCTRTIMVMLMVSILLLLGCWEGLSLRINDGKASDAVKRLRSAEMEFRSRNGKWGSLTELVNAGLAHRELEDGVESGYKFEVKVSGGTYEIVAYPIRPRGEDSYIYLGTSFYLDETGVIRGVSYGKGNNYTVACKNDQAIRYQK